MAASAATSGFGLVVEYLSTAPSTYSTIGELVSAKPPGKSRETIDVTHMASPDGYREIIGALRKGEPSDLIFNYTEAGAAILEELFDSDSETLRFTLPGGATVVSKVVVTAIDLDEVVVDDKMGMSMTVEPSGKPVYTAS